MQMAITTTNQFKSIVQEHVIHSLSTDTTEVLKEQLQNVVDEFMDWYKTPYEQKKNHSKQDAFISWMWGLPSCLSVEYWNDAIEKIYNGWFEKMGVQPKKLSQEKINHYYMHFIFREFSTLCKKNGVNF